MNGRPQCAPRGSRSDAMSRYDDDDDKYNKAKRGGRPAAFSAAKAPHLSLIHI